MRKPIGKRPKNLETSLRPKTPEEAQKVEALHDILQVGAHHARCANFQQLTIQFWYLFAERFAKKIESDPKASDEVRLVVAEYRRHYPPSTQPIVDRVIESLTERNP